MKTNKSKKKYDNQKALVIKQLGKNFEVTDNYVRMALRNEVNNETADKIRKEYDRLYKAIDKVLK